MSQKDNSLKDFSNGVEAASKKYKVKPYNVSPAQFWAVSPKISEWEVRKLGGFTALRELSFPSPEIIESDEAIIPRVKSVKYKASKLEAFNVHKTDLRSLFRSAGITDGVIKIVVQPDTHVPEHDPKALNSFKSFLKWYKPHGLINLGDFLENDSVSHWSPKSAKARRLVPEILEARTILKEIDDAAGPQCVYKRFLIGNHEAWLERLLIERVPEFYDGIEQLNIGIRVQDLLGLKDLGYRIIPENEILQIGDLHFIHGYYTGKYHAAKHLEVFRVNLMYGHVHDVQIHSTSSVGGLHEAVSLGCLRTLNAPFLNGKPNNWMHAFGIVEMRSDGTYTRYVPTIINGKFTFGGKEF